MLNLQDLYTPSLVGKEILVGVTGGIAAYKTAMLVSRLVQANARVQVVMTEAATHLVGPRTFESLTGRHVYCSMWDSGQPIPHIELARRAELVCVAPATANFLAKAACGIGDDLLSTIVLAFTGPILMAPAMNPRMWNKPAVQRNVATLIGDGFEIVGPEVGNLACGESGPGRMAEPDAIFDAVKKILKVPGP